MKKFFSIAFAAIPLLMSAQAASDAYTISQPDLRGTARFMSMAGAFGALGGDLSVLNQNPGGIGVYRSSDAGITLNFDNQSISAKDGVSSNSVNQFKFTCNNAGYIGAYKLDSEIVPNINWGFSYSRPVSYNRHYAGRINSLTSSLSNYVAGVTNNSGYTSSDMSYQTNDAGEDTYNPYTQSNAPWLSILSYNTYLTNPTQNGSNFKGLLGSGTTGFGEFETIEQGGVDEFNMDFGGNLSNMLYWGLGFGITDMDYKKYTYYGEGLTDAYIANATGQLVNGTASYGLENWLKTTGTGWNFKMGVIFKPVNEFRIGLAFHTPTYWSLKDEIGTQVNYSFVNNDFKNEGNGWANDGYTSESWYHVRTPWKFIASAATVISSKAILSFDYEYDAYNDMKVLSDNDEEYTDVTNNIQQYYKATNTFRIGGEYRVTPQFSLRAGYSYQSSPVKDEAYNNRVNIVTAGTTPAYTFDKSIQYYTAGLGYHYQTFYTDLAYVHKYRKGEYHAFSPEIDGNGNVVEATPTSSLKDNNNQIIWTIGVRF